MATTKKEFCELETAAEKPAVVRSGRESGGTVVNIVVIVVILGLVGLGVAWVIKNLGEAAGQYGQAMVDTSNKAANLKCQMNLRAIRENMRIYSVSNGSFPPSLEALVKWGATAELLRCPDAEGREYVFIAGQNESMSGDNVLVYEETAVHEGYCNVLRLNGQIQLLTEEQLGAALADTQERLARRQRRRR